MSQESLTKPRSNLDYSWPIIGKLVNGVQSIWSSMISTLHFCEAHTLIWAFTEAVAFEIYYVKGGINKTMVFEKSFWVCASIFLLVNRDIHLAGISIREDCCTYKMR